MVFCTAETFISKVGDTSDVCKIKSFINSFSSSSYYISIFLFCPNSILQASEERGGAPQVQKLNQSFVESFWAAHQIRADLQLANTDAAVFHYWQSWRCACSGWGKPNYINMIYYNISATEKQISCQYIKILLQAFFIKPLLCKSKIALSDKKHLLKVIQRVQWMRLMNQQDEKGTQLSVFFLSSLQTSDIWCTQLHC